MTIGILALLRESGRGDVGRQCLYNQVLRAIGSFLVVALLGALVLVVLLSLAIDVIALQDVVHNAVTHTGDARFT